MSTDTVVQRWWLEHNQIDDLVKGIRAKLDRRELSAASESIERLAATVERHFGTEENLYFPLVERASPGSAGLIRGARLGHQRLRDGIGDLLVLVENADLASAQRALAKLLDRLQQHEVEEAALMADLEQLPQSNRGSG